MPCPCGGKQPKIVYVRDAHTGRVVARIQQRPKCLGGMSTPPAELTRRSKR